MKYFTRKLKQQDGRDIWLIGGGQVNRVMLENKLIDEVFMTIIPVLLKEGIDMYNGFERDVVYTEVSNKTYPNGFIKKHWLLK